MPFKTDLVVRYLGGELWETTAPLVYDAGRFGIVTVPAGHRTDFCSVPRLPFIYAMVGDIGEPAGTVHDYLYSSGELPRESADRVFYLALRDCGVGPTKAGLMYKAVRVFGTHAWNYYRGKDK